MEINKTEINKMEINMMEINKTEINKMEINKTEYNAWSWESQHNNFDLLKKTHYKTLRGITTT